MTSTTSITPVGLLTCLKKKWDYLIGLDMRDGVEEWCLPDTVHGVDVGPQGQADGDDLHPVGPSQGPGTAGLVED